jgi:hypothetical protein
MKITFLSVTVCFYGLLLFCFRIMYTFYFILSLYQVPRMPYTTKNFDIFKCTDHKPFNKIMRNECTQQVTSMHETHKTIHNVYAFYVCVVFRTYIVSF